MRRPIFAANWKMHKNRDEAASYVRDLLPRVAGVEVVALGVGAEGFERGHGLVSEQVRGYVRRRGPGPDGAAVRWRGGPQRDTAAADHGAVDRWRQSRCRRGRRMEVHSA